MVTPTAQTSLFDRWSAVYDRPRLQALTYRPIHDAVLRRLDGNSPSTIVDLGCGTGQLSARLIERFPHATIAGIDFSAGMLAEAAQRLSADPSHPYALLRADAEKLPLAPSSIDAVVCTESFHWYHHQAETLEGLAEVLRPDGRLIIASIATLTSRAESLIRGITAPSGRTIRALAPHQMRRLLRQSGFEVLHQQRIPRVGAVPWPVLTDARLL
ncbi:MAG: class I SAM-dependent methyltransferase [Actinomycetia bacterium]|nr:class I SAM-dependent methyltransferase [Actinomycetes bacterium]MCP3911622.1 class I SAM-dependent methyltransferase [Actinomycetes bacterium]